MVEAVSGQEVVEQRSNLIRDLTKLCKAGRQAPARTSSTPADTEGFPPEIRDCPGNHTSTRPAPRRWSSPSCTSPEDQDKDKAKVPDRIPFGCLVAEQIGDELAPTDAHARCEVVSRHASTALWNASEYDRALLPVLKMIGTPWRFFRGRTLAKILGVVAALVSIVLILTFVPWQLTIEGKGSLLPQERQNLYAPVAGIVQSVLVHHADPVKEGEVVCELESKELQKEYNKLLAAKQEADSQQASLRLQSNNRTTSVREDERISLNAQAAEAKIKSDSAEKQIKIILEQLESMKIRAPHDGIITTWEPQKTLMGRPVEIGTELLQIAATTGEWVMDVEVPDDDMGPILAARSKLQAEIAAGTKPADSTLEAYFVTATDPEHRYSGYVRQISARAETVEQRHVVKVTVGFSDKVRADFLTRNQSLRPGSEVRARVQCGEARLAYVLFRDVIHVFYETVLFRWPFLQ